MMMIGNFETACRDYAFEGGKVKSEYAPQVAACQERLKEVKANLAFLQLFSSVQSRLKGRVCSYQVKTRDKIIAYDDPVHDRRTVFVEKGIVWTLQVFQNVVVKPQPEGFRPDLWVSERDYVEILPGVRVHQLELRTPESRTGDELKCVFQTEEGGFSSWEIRDPYQWGLSRAGSSPGMSIVTGYVTAAADGRQLETNYDLTARLMDGSESFEYRSKKQLLRNVDLLKEMGQSVAREHHGLQEWVEDLSKGRLWIPRSAEKNLLGKDHVWMI